MALDGNAPNDLNAFWMPVTANRPFKKDPRMFVAATDMHHTTADGRQVLDGSAGLWCCNAGHCRPKKTEAIQVQAAKMDDAPAFQMGHPLAFEHANRIIDIAPTDTCREEGLFDRARDLEGDWQDAIRALRDLPYVIDIHNMGRIGAVELEGIPGEPSKRAFTAVLKADEQGILIRTTGDIISKAQIDELIGSLGDVQKALE